MTISRNVIIVKFEQYIIVFISLARVLPRGNNWLCCGRCILSLLCLLLSLSRFLSLSLLLLAFSPENSFSVVQAETVLPPGRVKGEEEVKDYNHDNAEATSNQTGSTYPLYIKG
jgi:hypothetical protein